MSSRHEFVTLASAPGANVQSLCRTFGISRKTGYLWLKRYREEGVQGLAERSRKPQSVSPNEVTLYRAQILALHDAYPCWGGRKLAALLPERRGKPPHHNI